MCEDDAEFGGRHRGETRFVPLAAERLIGGFPGLADVKPFGAGPMLDGIRGGRLYSPSVVVDREFDSAKLHRLAEVDFQPIGF